MITEDIRILELALARRELTLRRLRLQSVIQRARVEEATPDELRQANAAVEVQIALVRRLSGEAA